MILVKADDDSTRDMVGIKDEVLRRMNGKEIALI